MANTRSCVFSLNSRMPPARSPRRAKASFGPAGEGPVEVKGGADQCQVSKGLREVAQSLSAGPGLLGVQPDVVAVTQHLLEQQPGLGQAVRVGSPGPSQRLDQPEAAHIERPFHARKPIRGRLWIVAVNQPV